MKSLKILWIEDDSKRLKGLVKPLERDGHKIFCAEDQEEALKLIDNDEFNLIIVDLIIPSGEKNATSLNHFVGLNLIKILKAKNILTPICVLSVVRDQDIIRELQDMGIKKILQKGSLLPSNLRKEIYDILSEAKNDYY